MSRSRSEIAADCRREVYERSGSLLYEALAELLDPAQPETTLLGYTLAQWEQFGLADEKMLRIRAVFAAPHALGDLLPDEEMGFIVSAFYSVPDEVRAAFRVTPQ